jgi:hypothetical protein
MHRTVRSFYAVAVAVFWTLCIALGVAVHTPVAIGFVVLFAVLDAGAMWLAFREAKAGIQRNTGSRADGPDVGL